MENQTDNTVELKPKVQPKSGEKPQKKLSQTEQRLKYLTDKVDQIVKYLVQLEQQEAQQKVKEIACTLEILDTVYKDCPKVREDSITKEETKNYIPVMGLYHKETTKNQIVKIIPLEEGWKMISITPDNPEKPTSFTANYEFKGVLPKADYPTTWTITGEDPYSFTMKLREYLLSLKEEIIITSETFKSK